MNRLYLRSKSAGIFIKNSIPNMENPENYRNENLIKQFITDQKYRTNLETPKNYGPKPQLKYNNKMILHVLIKVPMLNFILLRLFV